MDTPTHSQDLLECLTLQVDQVHHLGLVLPWLLAFLLVQQNRFYPAQKLDYYILKCIRPLYKLLFLYWVNFLCG